MSKERRYFGTDGVRGTVGTFPVTPDFALKLGWATGKVLSRSGGTVLIGKDTRISGYMFESALEAGLTAAGVDIRLLGPMPTPAVAYLTRTFQAQAGIVISASHNHFEDNGFKFFSGQGTKLDDDIEMEIEAMLDEPLLTVSSNRIGKASRISDASGRYIEFCKSTVPGTLSLQGLKLVVDCAHGATYQVAPSVFRELGAEVTAIGNKPDGLNINDGYGSTRPQNLARAVLANHADLGIAFDGDGDRVIMVDSSGAVVDGDELLYIIATSKINGDRRGSRQGEGVVGTEMTNLGLELALESQNIPFCRAKVGDRYVMSELLSREWRFGGESSGHIICLDSTSTGDGIIAALQVLRAMAVQERSLSELRSGMSKLPQTMINVRVQDKARLHNNDKVSGAVKEVEATLGKEGRVLLRPSGTEPVVRVMVEGVDAALVSQLAQELSQVVEKEVA